jgi:HSP20 family molecular chaperone IbpA
MPNVAYCEDALMSRVSLFSSPFLLGFEAFEERLDRLAKSGESYPPYNIERIAADNGGEKFIISIAVAGFAKAELEVVVEDSQLQVRGRAEEKGSREFLHRGIATRQFQRTFLLADGMSVEGAEITNGLLQIHVEQPPASGVSRKIEIHVKS